MVQSFEQALRFRERAILVTFIFIILVFIIPPKLISTDVSNFLTTTTVLFAIICGFFIATVFSNYSRLQSLIAEETAGLISLHIMCKYLNSSIEKDVDDAIDKYLIAAFDFELIDYIDNTWEEFNSILKVIDKISRDTDLFATLIGQVSNLLKVRQEIILTTRRIMNISNWIISAGLATLIIILLFSSKDSSLVSMIFTVSLSSATFFVLFLLDEIDSNRFAEEKISFDIYQRVFKEIGKLPYYPEVSIKSRRVQPPKGAYRVGKYKDFPKSLDKKIEIVRTS